MGCCREEGGTNGIRRGEGGKIGTVAGRQWREWDGVGKTVGRMGC